MIDWMNDTFFWTELVRWIRLYKTRIWMASLQGGGEQHEQWRRNERWHFISERTAMTMQIQARSKKQEEPKTQTLNHTCFLTPPLPSIPHSPPSNSIDQDNSSRYPFSLYHQPPILARTLRTDIHAIYSITICINFLCSSEASPTDWLGNEEEKKMDVFFFPTPPTPRQKKLWKSFLSFFFFFFHYFHNITMMSFNLFIHLDMQIIPFVFLFLSFLSKTFFLLHSFLSWFRLVCISNCRKDRKGPFCFFVYTLTSLFCVLFCCFALAGGFMDIFSNIPASSCNNARLLMSILFFLF